MIKAFKDLVAWYYNIGTVTHSIVPGPTVVKC